MSHSNGVRPKRDTKHDVGLVSITLAAVLLIWFVAANTQKVQVHFWVFTAHASLISVILISAVLGALLSFLIARARKRKKF
jgi:uncharacterized integral membrane protein